jgi:hypothetical protein
MKQLNFNRYGSYEIDHIFECTICLDKNTIMPKNCCGKIIC